LGHQQEVEVEVEAESEDDDGIDIDVGVKEVKMKRIRDLELFCDHEEPRWLVSRRLEGWRKKRKKKRKRNRGYHSSVFCEEEFFLMPFFLLSLSSFHSFPSADHEEDSFDSKMESKKTIRRDQRSISLCVWSESKTKALRKE